jgi:hypothetical protein
VNVVALAALFITTRARAGGDDDDEWALGAGAEASAQTRFLWRGVAWSRGPVLQPSAWGSAIGLTANAWCNVMLTQKGGAQPSAIAASIARDFAWRSLRIAPALHYYELPQARAPAKTAEASLDAELELDDFRLSTTHALDIANHPRAYFGTAGVAYEPEIGPFAISVATDVAWASAAMNREYFRRDAWGLSLAEAALSARYDLTDEFYFVLHAEGSALVAPALRAAASEPALAAAGATFGFEL